MAHYNEHIIKKLSENDKYDKIRHNDDEILELALIRGKTLKETANTIQDEINKMIQAHNNTRNYADVRLEKDEEWELETSGWKIYKVKTNGTRGKTTHLLEQMVPIFEEIKPEQIANNILIRIKKNTQKNIHIKDKRLQLTERFQRNDENQWEILQYTNGCWIRTHKQLYPMHPIIQINTDDENENEQDTNKEIMELQHHINAGKICKIQTNQGTHYKCNLCTKHEDTNGDTSINRLRHHMATQHTRPKKDKYYCPYCPRFYTNLNQLEIHTNIRQQRGKEAYNIMKCPAIEHNYTWTHWDNILTKNNILPAPREIYDYTKYMKKQ